MAKSNAGSSLGNGRMQHNTGYPVVEIQDQMAEQQDTDDFGPFSPTLVLSPVSSLDSEDLSDAFEEHSPRLELDRSQEEQIETLKEFLSEAQVRSDDSSAQNQQHADTVKAMEGLSIATSSSSQGASHTNTGAEKQTGGYYPSETLYFQEQKMKDKEVEDGHDAVLNMYTPASVATTPAKLAGSPMKSPRSVDADKALKNELDFLFQERASTFKLE